MFGPFGQSGQEGKKVDWRNSEQLLRVAFSTFCGQKNSKFFQKYYSIRIEKLHKMAIINYLLLKKFEKTEKIGYNSNFNFECNAERSFKESLSIALG